MGKTENSQFIIVVRGIPQTERNYSTRGQAEQVIKDFGNYLTDISEVVEYVPK